MTPQKANTLSKLAKLPFDNVMLGRRRQDWALVEESRISISFGQSIVTMPKKAFEALADWYFKGRIPKAERRKL